jgi:chromodomain-helicase-DNA-binding protein 1
MRLKPPAWSEGIGWDAVNDAMLLVGVHRFGFGAWERIRDDPSLGLSSKMAPAGENRRGSMGGGVRR